MKLNKVSLSNAPNDWRAQESYYVKGTEIYLRKKA